MATQEDGVTVLPISRSASRTFFPLPGSSRKRWQRAVAVRIPDPEQLVRVLLHVRRDCVFEEGQLIMWFEH
jgi:hypothetical protein